MKQIVFIILIFSFTSLVSLGQNIKKDSLSIEERVKRMELSLSMVILAGEMAKGNKNINLSTMPEWREAFNETNFDTYWRVLVKTLESNYKMTIKSSSLGEVGFVSAYKKKFRYFFDPEKFLLVRKGNTSNFFSIKSSQTLVYELFFLLFG